MRRALTAALPAIFAFAGCTCFGGGQGDLCRVNSECAAGLYCSPVMLQCVPFGADASQSPGTDAAPMPCGVGP